MPRVTNEIIDELTKLYIERTELRQEIEKLKRKYSNLNKDFIKALTEDSFLISKQSHMLNEYENTIKKIQELCEKKLTADNFQIVQIIDELKNSYNYFLYYKVNEVINGDN